MKQLVKKSVFCSIAIALFCSSSPIFAISFSSREDFVDFLDRNGIFYYDPSGFTEDCYSGVGSFDGIVTAGLSALQAAFVDKFHDIAAQLGAQYGIPWEAVMAQGIIESASGTSRFAVERYNYFGLGAVDSNPSAAYTYSSPAEGWRGYFEFISNNPRYRKNGAFDYPNDPFGYIQALKRAGYATDPNYVSKISSMIKAIQNRSSEKSWKSSGEMTGSSGSVSAHLCEDEGNGDINSTALKLSWADRSHALDDPTALYKKALESVGLSTYGDQYVRIGASCDAFVATVLRYSGADPNVPCCGTTVMLNYFASHPEKYQEIPNIGNSSNLQSGDIRVKPGHIEIYVIDENGNGRIASASHGDRTADHGIGYYADSSYRIFRLRS